MCLAAVKFSTADGGSFFESGIVNIKLSCRATVEELVLISVHVTAQCERGTAVVRHQFDEGVFYRRDMGYLYACFLLRQK